MEETMLVRMARMVGRGYGEEEIARHLGVGVNWVRMVGATDAFAHVLAELGVKGKEDGREG